MKNYIFLGPPGSGKGTQAKILAEKQGAFYFGAGDLMRKEAQCGTEYGKQFQAVWDKGEGQLVPEKISDGFLESKLQEVKGRQVIFDGYPRTLKQAEMLERYFPSENIIVINISLNDKALVLRATTRRVCEKCGKIFFRADLSGITKCDKCSGNLVQRQEDTEEIVKKRIEVYNNETKPLIDYFENKGILINIDGEPPIEDVTAEINQKL